MRAHARHDICVEEIRLSCHCIVLEIVLVSFLVAVSTCLAGSSEVSPLDRRQFQGEGVVVQGHIVDAYHIYRLSFKLLDEQGKRELVAR